jgi:hypothetical protein
LPVNAELARRAAEHLRAHASEHGELPWPLPDPCGAQPAARLDLKRKREEREESPVDLPPGEQLQLLINSDCNIAVP